MPLTLQEKRVQESLRLKDEYQLSCLVAPKLNDAELLSYDAPAPFTKVADLSDEVNLFSSRNPHNSNKHTPMFDLDFPVTLVESSTPGHYHLYLNKQIPWQSYVELMDVMKRCGLLQAGWVACAKKEQQATLRPPHVFKNNHYDVLLSQLANEG